jgi:ubiquitin carboxyl-terminal hydrolase 14
MAVEKTPFANNHGVYDLWAVLSHQGRDSDGGHYIAFIRQSEDEDDWLEFDDDKVSRRNSEDVKKLSGAGGVDWHIAYMVQFFYLLILTS